MKKILIFSAAISMFAACNSDQKSSETTKDVVGVTDSTAYKNNTLADTGHVVAAPLTLPETTRIEKRVETVKKAPIRKTTPKKTSTGSVMTPTPVSTDTKTSTSTSTTGTTETSTAATPAPVPEKKGMSSAAKGAAIGGVGGAIGGAIISKKKGKGAIIGGVLGAAGGYIIGRKKDKKEQAADTTR